MSDRVSIYLRDRFLPELDVFLRQVAEQSECMRRQVRPSFQLVHLDGRLGCLQHVADEDRPAFLMGLHHLVLLDQSVHFEHRAAHPGFERRALPVKLRGPCPGGCYYHIHPSRILGVARQICASQAPDWPATQAAADAWLSEWATSRGVEQFVHGAMRPWH
jgi:hypothetical protein